MNLLQYLLAAVLPLLLTGCPWGDYAPPAQFSTVTRSNTGLCFSFVSEDSFQAWHLNIRTRGEPEGGGFNKLLPALKVSDNQICIPNSYYNFPNNGEFYVNNTLRSSTQRDQRLILISVFRLVNGQPQMLEPEPGEF